MSELPAPCADRGALLAVYERDREVHPYGIADLVQLWGRSRWWRTGSTVIGLLDLPGSPLPVVYAIAARAPKRTLAGLAALVHAGSLPDRFVITGPRGLASALGEVMDARWSTTYVKQVLRDVKALPDPDPTVRVLARRDLAALRALHASDPTAAGFFHPDLLDTGAYVGLEVDGRLVSSAGVHVLAPEHGVAAIGNVLTHPRARGHGYARRTVAALCHLLRAEVDTIGLNVAAANLTARRLYAGLGFVEVHAYEEAELERQARRPLHDATTRGSLRAAP
ncbi:MAG: GNAT family N-acetyltransferase [Nitriliruptoraceae bacterium]